MDSHMTKVLPSFKVKTRETNPALMLRTISQPTATVGAAAWAGLGLSVVMD